MRLHIKGAVNKSCRTVKAVKANMINKRVQLSLEAYILPVHSFSPPTPTPRGCTQSPLASYQLHCILKNGRGNESQFHCLRFSRSSCQVDCARKNRQLSGLYVLLKSLLIIMARKVRSGETSSLLQWAVFV